MNNLIITKQICVQTTIHIDDLYSVQITIYKSKHKTLIISSIIFDIHIAAKRPQLFYHFMPLIDFTRRECLISY